MVELAISGAVRYCCFFVRRQNSPKDKYVLLLVAHIVVFDHDQRQLFLSKVQFADFLPEE